MTPERLEDISNIISLGAYPKALTWIPELLEEAQLSRIPHFRVGDWVRCVMFDDKSLGLVEAAQSDRGLYQIRLVTQWTERNLPLRTGVGFERVKP